jgi:hypothetical protein
MVRQAPTETTSQALGAAIRNNRDALSDGEAPISLDEVAAGVDHCRRCDLWRDATQGVAGEGPGRAKLLFVGEQPGDQEDLAGKPFVGPAGQVFDKAMAEAGVPRTETYVTNAVKHFKHELRGKRRIHQTRTPARSPPAAGGWTPSAGSSGRGSSSPWAQPPAWPSSASPRRSGNSAARRSSYPTRRRGSSPTTPPTCSASPTPKPRRRPTPCSSRT